MTDPGGGAVRIAAPAKINLYLHITGRRDSGFHELDSLVAFAGAGDTVIARPARALGLSVEGPFAHQIPSDGGNLVLKAARALARASAVEAGADLTLTKRLPVASGIGGGSADAAATLRALAILWDLPPAAPDAVALGIGADVPVCLGGRTAFMGGIGETLTPAPPLPPVWVVLANPGVAVSTPAIFAARSGDFSDPAPFGGPVPNAGALAALLKERRNDLTEPARRLAPVIGKVLGALEEQADALLARMSGSGATCFALFAEEGGAQRAAARLGADHPDWWVHAAALLNAKLH